MTRKCGPIGGEPLVLRGEDARRFEEYLDAPPTENDREIARRVKEMQNVMEREEFIRMVEKRNCGNCRYTCPVSGNPQDHTCVLWDRESQPVKNPEVKKKPQVMEDALESFKGGRRGHE